jgi:ADP-ribose pyrophosphatase YjhB (NUDIX family)
MSESIRSILTGVAHPFKWLSSKANRLRARGARVEIISCILCRNPEPSILLGQSPYHNMWMPPQEGVNLKETFQQALHRCLQVECGINLPINPTHASKKLHFRSIRYFGQVPLPPERIGERPIADDVHGTWLESVTIRRKAYWMATILVSERTDISPKADGKELLDLAWHPLSDARKLIEKTNHAEKARLLLQLIDVCERDLCGATLVPLQPPKTESFQNIS